MTIQPITSKTVVWIKENCIPYQVLDEGIEVEQNFAAEVIEGMLEDGLIPDQDFELN